MRKKKERKTSLVRSVGSCQTDDDRKFGGLEQHWTLLVSATQAFTVTRRLLAFKATEEVGRCEVK